MTEFQPADPQARRRALLLLMTAAGLGSVAILSRDAVVHAIGLRLDLVQWILPAVLAGSAVAAALWAWRLGARIVASGRFPPPGIRVVRRTPILTGDAAKRRGRALQWLGVTLLALLLLLSALAWQLMRLLAAMADGSRPSGLIP